jgi:hypothetical protein
MVVNMMAVVLADMVIDMVVGSMVVVMGTKSPFGFIGFSVSRFEDIIVDLCRLYYTLNGVYHRNRVICVPHYNG